MATYVPPKRGAEFIFYVTLVSQADTKLFQNNPTIAAGDFQVSKDGGSFANLTTLPAVTPASSDSVKITLSATEMTADQVLVVASDAAGAQWCDQSWTIQTAANQIDSIYSDTTIIASDLVIITSDTTAIHSDTTIIASDVLQVYSDTTIIASDVMQVYSDTTVVTSDLVIITSDTTAIHSDTTIIASDVVIIGSDTAVIEAATPAALTSGTADSGTTTTLVDAARTEADTDYWKGSWVRFTSGTISGQARLITAFTPASDTLTFTPATTQAVGTNTYEIWPAAFIEDVVDVSSNLTVVASDTVVIESSVQVVETDTGNIYSDTTIIASDVVQVYSDTTVVTSDLVIITSDTTAIHSDTTVIASDVVQVYSDTTTIASDLVIITSDTTAIHSDTTIIASDVVIIGSDAVVIESSVQVVETGVNVTQISGDTVAADNLEAMMDGIIVAQVNDASATTTAFAADGFTEATDDHFNGRLITFITGALAGQQTDITDYDAVGHAQGSQAFVVTALTEAPANNDFFVIH